MSNGYLPQSIDNFDIDDVQWKHFAFGSSSTVGLSTHNEQLFDGIACNDGHLAAKFSGANSGLHKRTPLLGNWISEATIEFWFKPMVTDVNETGYLYSMWAMQTEHEFFSIYYA
jgi:hypothetical protein